MDHLPNLKICLAGICVYASGDCFKDLDVNDFEKPLWRNNMERKNDLELRC